MYANITFSYNLKIKCTNYLIILFLISLKVVLTGRLLWWVEYVEVQEEEDWGKNPGAAPECNQKPECEFVICNKLKALY